MRSTKQLNHGMPSQTVVQVIGGTLGDSAAREGVTEAARRLSHALAEIANVLDGSQADEHDLRVACARASEKAEGTLKEWGVA